MDSENEQRASLPGRAALASLGSPRIQKKAPGILVALLLLFTVLKVLVVSTSSPESPSVYNLGFGFGSYIHTLRHHNELAACPQARCERASRLPFLPVFVAAASFISEDAAVVSLFKAVLLSAGVFLLGRRVFQNHTASNPSAAGMWIFFTPLLALSPTVAKHASALTYEEGFLTEFLFALSLCLLLSIQPSLPLNARLHRSISYMATAAVVLALLCVLMKSAMVLVFLVVVITCGLIAAQYRDILVAGAVMLSVLCLGSWGLRNALVTGKFTIMSSYDGVNFFRGWNSESERIYPAVSLDRVTDSRRILAADNQVIEITKKPHRASFQDEWAWDHYYKQLGLNWVKANPSRATAFFWRKVSNFVLSTHKTPGRIEAFPQPRGRVERAYDTMTGFWLLVGRGNQLIFILLCLIGLLSTDPLVIKRIITAVLLLGAYAAPFVFGYNSERHISVFLVMLIACNMVLGADIVRIRVLNQPAA